MSNLNIFGTLRDTPETTATETILKDMEDHPKDCQIVECVQCQV